MTTQRPSEFDLIAKYFAPLSAGAPLAFGLLDDAALIRPEASHDIVVTKDMLVEGVHFLPDDPPELVSRKLLRVNLSDLAAMGAAPLSYALAISCRPETDAAWFERFAAGLAADQAIFPVHLIGGDTVAADGPLTFSITAFGQVPVDQAIRRKGAQPGDLIYVSGTIGDAVLGLNALGGGLAFLSEDMRTALEGRYRLPEPRVDLGPKLLGLASAAIDVSDGLAADLGHICEVSGVGAEVQAAQVPLSDAARHVIAADAAWLARLLAGGDDYELVFTAKPDSRDRIAQLSQALGLSLTQIGQVTQGDGALFNGEDGQPIDLKNAGYSHF